MKGKNMSNDNTQTTPTTEPTAEPPAGSAHVEDATAMILEIQTMGQRISRFAYPADENANRRLAQAASVPQAAIDKVTALVQTKPLLTGTSLGPDDLRDRVTFISAYGPVPDEAEAFAQGLRHTLNVVKAEVGDATLVAYEVAKRQARRADGADLRPHVADLRRLLSARFPGPKKNRKQTAPQPAPDVATQPSSSTTAPADPAVTAPVTKPQ
jgi:hypothetical protein